MARKDAEHAMRIAQDSGMSMRALSVIDHHLLQIKERAGAKGDIAGIYGAVRQESQLPYENREGDSSTARVNCWEIS